MMIRHKVILCFLLLLSIFTGSFRCAAKTEDSIWRNYQPDWQWGKREWDTVWGNVRELLSDNIGNLPVVPVTFTIPQGQKILEKSDFPDAQENDRITEVSLPESLQVIDDIAFSRLRYLQKITIPAGVTSIGKNIFYNCRNLRTIVNLSSQAITLEETKSFSEEQFYPGPLGLEYYVDGKRVMEIPPGKTAVGIEKTFPVDYDLNGGRMTGKTTTQYRFGDKETKLPKAERKGYIFLGWSYYHWQTFYNTWFSFYNEKGLVSGEITLKARWKKVRVKRNGKRKIKIQLYNRDYSDNWKIACLYSVNKNMKGAKLVYLGEDFKKNKKKMISGTTVKNCTTRYYPKKRLLTAEIKNLKRGKAYYLQFRRIHELATSYYYINKKVLKTVKVSA